MTLELTEQSTTPSQTWLGHLELYLAQLDTLYADPSEDICQFIDECKILGVIRDDDKIFWQPHIESEDKVVLLAALIRVLWRNLMEEHGLDVKGYPLRDEVLEAREITRT